MSVPWRPWSLSRPANGARAAAGPALWDRIRPGARLYIAETGYTTADAVQALPGHPCPAASVPAAAAEGPQRSPGAMVVSFNLQGHQTWLGGLVDPEGRRKPAWRVFRVLARRAGIGALTEERRRRMPSPESAGSPPAMTTVRTDRTLIVLLSGEIDVTGAENLGQAVDLLDLRERRVVIDLSGARFADCGGLTLLADLHDRCGTVPTLRGVRPPQEQLLAQTGLDRAFTVHRDPVHVDDGESVPRER